MDKVLVHLDRVIAFHAVADEVETRIRDGPSGDINTYLELLNKLKEALDFFIHNNAQSVELGHVGELFEVGLEALSREFLQLLKKHSRPVPVAALHDVASIEDGEGVCCESHVNSLLLLYTHTSSDLPPLDLLPVQVVLDLHVIAEYLVHAPGQGHTDVMNVYSQLRSSTLGRGLNSIKELNQSGQTLLGANVSM